jgi:hypothetical protein
MYPIHEDECTEGDAFALVTFICGLCALRSQIITIRMQLRLHSRLIVWLGRRRVSCSCASSACTRARHAGLKSMVLRPQLSCRRRARGGDFCGGGGGDGGRLRRRRRRPLRLMRTRKEPPMLLRTRCLRHLHGRQSRNGGAPALPCR